MPQKAEGLNLNLRRLPGLKQLLQFQKNLVHLRQRVNPINYSGLQTGEITNTYRKISATCMAHQIILNAIKTVIQPEKQHSSSAWVKKMLCWMRWSQNTYYSLVRIHSPL